MSSRSSLFSQLDAHALHTAWLALGLTLKVALSATLLNGVLGIACAWWMARRTGPLWTVLDAVLTLPMVLPPTVIGYYLLV
ncbi:MAG: hypothetical protein HYZ45_09925, partial [Burkholderiales bacterium]|nr:hypothetical protein [Burkholderiales bacterium]